MPDDLPESWCLTPGAEFAVRCWGDECLVHHRLSNDTHRLSRWAAELLQTLGAGPASIGELAHRHDRDPAELEAALQTLAGLDLVQAGR